MISASRAGTISGFEEEQKLEEGERYHFGQLGWSVAISGDTAVTDSMGVYQRTTEGWTKVAQLATDAGDQKSVVAIDGDTVAMALQGGALLTRNVHPADAGLSLHPASALAGGTPEYNATRLRALLAGQHDAYRDMVVLNAAAALTVMEPALQLSTAAARAAAAIDSGAAQDVLNRWIAFR